MTREPTYSPPIIELGTASEPSFGRMTAMSGSRQIALQTSCQGYRFSYRGVAERRVDRMLKEIVLRIARAARMFNPETAPDMAFYQQPFEADARASRIEPAAAPMHNTASYRSRHAA